MLLLANAEDIEFSKCWADSHLINSEYQAAGMFDDEQ